MMYAPTCKACREQDPQTFYRSCSGCQARKDRIEAQRSEPSITPQHAAGMDSTMGQLGGKS
jgi:hypothetical protein